MQEAKRLEAENWAVLDELGEWLNGHFILDIPPPWIFASGFGLICAGFGLTCTGFGICSENGWFGTWKL